MEIRYRREARKTFMYLGSTEKNTGYEERMMQHIRHENLLPFHIDYMEKKKCYCYEISSMQPLERIAERGGMTVHKLKMFILQLDHVLEVLEKHMLSDGALFLCPQTIYLDSEQEQFRFCAVPCGNNDFTGQMQALCLFLLPHLEEGSGAVLLCHAMYRVGFQKMFSSRQLFRILIEQNKQTRRAEIKDEKFEEAEKNLQHAENKYIENRHIENRYIENRHLENREEVGNARIRPVHKFAAEEWQESRKEQERFEEQEGKLFSRYLPKNLLQILICAAVFCAAPAAVFMLRGSAAVLRMMPVFCAAAIGMTLLFVLQRIEKKKREDREDREKGVDSDQMQHLFHGSGTAAYADGYSQANEWDLNDPEFGLHAGNGDGTEQIQNGFSAGVFELPDSGAAEDENPMFSTRQIWEIEKSPQKHRRLIPLNKELPEILLDHFPFVIGKNKKMSDFILRDERVSRMHLRFHKEGEQYFMTDLNSANGTKLGEYLLNANETVSIQPGQELAIAGIGYVFA